MAKRTRLLQGEALLSSASLALGFSTTGLTLGKTTVLMTGAHSRERRGRHADKRTREPEESIKPPEMQQTT